MNFYTAMIGGVVMNIIHGEPIYLPPRGPAFIHLFIMGSYDQSEICIIALTQVIPYISLIVCAVPLPRPMWIGWLTSQKVWTDADADSEKDDSG
jgi:hypothetical protein